MDSPKPVSEWDKITEGPDSTCAQVVHSNAEICEDKMVPMATKEYPEQEEQHGKTKCTDLPFTALTLSYSRITHIACVMLNVRIWCV